MNIVFLINNDVYASHCLSLLESSLSTHKTVVFYTEGLIKRPPELTDIFAPLLKAEKNLQKTIPRLPCSYYEVTERSFPLDKLQVADLIISIRFGHILSKDQLSSIPSKILNLHSGLLPHYRGVMATFWAMMNEESVHGFTLHEMVEKIDSGTIYATNTMPLDLNASLLQNTLNLYQPAAKLLSKIIAQQVTFTPQQVPSQPEMYYTFPTQEAVARFHKRGFKFY